MAEITAEVRDQIIEECRQALKKGKYDATKSEQFCNTVSDLLQEIIDRKDEGRELKYKIKKHFDSIELRIDLSGEKIDPMTEGEGAEQRNQQKQKNSLLFNPETSISTGYSGGWNHLVIKSPSRIANSKLMNEPMVKALILGAIAGFLCRLLPAETKDLFLNEIAAPVMSTVINLLMGIMGPVFFLFIIVSVSSLGSMEKLASIGKIILKRFLLISFWVALLTCGVALVFFPVFGSRSIAIDLPAVEGVLLDIVPSDFFSPFMKGNIPQVILFGLVFGTALLMMGDRAQPVRDALLKIKEWVMGVMMIMMKIITVIPFVSTMMIVANGETTVFLQGWKYIAATYICYLLFLLIEFIAVSLRCKKGIKDLAKMLKEIAVMAFITATPAATMQLSYDVSEKKMGIEKSFSDMWLSLSYNLLSPARTISLVLSAFFIADLTGQTMDVAVIAVMVLTVIQLTLASSGTVGGSTILLETLKMPTDKVGLFSAFDVFTRNAGSAFDITYSMLDQLDAARECEKKEKKRENSSQNIR